MRRALTFFIVLSLIALPATADLCFFGYTGAITDIQRFGTTIGFNQWLYQQQQFNNIDTSIGIVSSPPDYTLLRDAFPAIVSSFANHQTDMILDFTNMLFERRSSGTVNCAEYGGSSSTPATLGVKMKIHPNWQNRLADFAATAAPLVNPGNTELIIVHGEVNNNCVRSWMVNSAASALKAMFPGIPVIAVYESESDSSFAQGLPSRFPRDLDHVGFFAYGVYDPNDPGHPKNSTIRPFYDPANPLSTSTQWGDFVSRLRPYQEVDATLEAFFSNRQVNNGWTENDLAQVATNWNAWVASQPRIHGMAAFKWTGTGALNKGTQSLPLSVRSAHRAVANSVMSCP